MQWIDCTVDLRKLLLKHLGTNFLDDGNTKTLSDCAIDSLVLVEFIFAVEEHFDMSIAEGVEMFTKKDITTNDFFEKMKQLTCEKIHK